MDRVFKVKCQNLPDCNHLNVFNESDLVGSVPLVDKDGNRVPPPPVEIDEHTVIACEKCGYPVRCVQLNDT